MREYQGGLLADYPPYSPYTEKLFGRLAALKPERLAIMHGSSFEGDGVQALSNLAVVCKETFGRRSPGRDGHSGSDTRQRSNSRWEEVW